MSDKTTRSRLCAREIHKRLRIEPIHRRTQSDNLQEAAPISAVLRRYQKDPSSFTPAIKKALKTLVPPNLQQAGAQYSRRPPNRACLPSSRGPNYSVRNARPVHRASDQLPESEFILTPTSLYEGNQQYIRSLKSSGLRDYLFQQQLKLGSAHVRDKYMPR